MRMRRVVSLTMFLSFIVGGVGNTLARFTRGLVDWERLEHQRNVSLPVPIAAAALRDAGLTVESADQLLIDIANANANGTTPQALMGILREAEPERSTRQLAGQLGTDPEGVIELLNERARAATP